MTIQLKGCLSAQIVEKINFSVNKYVLLTTSIIKRNQIEFNLSK